MHGLRFGGDGGFAVMGGGVLIIIVVGSRKIRGGILTWVKAFDGGRDACQGRNCGAGVDTRRGGVGGDEL